MNNRASVSVESEADAPTAWLSDWNRWKRFASNNEAVLCCSRRMISVHWEWMTSSSKKIFSDCTARAIRTQFVFVILISIVATLWEKCCKQYQFFAIVVRHRKSILKCTQHFFLSLSLNFTNSKIKQDSDIFRVRPARTHKQSHTRILSEKSIASFVYFYADFFFKERQRRIYRRRELVPHRLHDCFMNSVPSRINRTTTRLTVALHRRIVLAPSVV